MKLMVTGISLPFTVPVEEALHRAAGMLGNPAGARYLVARRSLDARRKSDIRFVYSVVADLEDVRGNPYKDRSDIRVIQEEQLAIKEAVASGSPPVVAGFGPAGMFAGLILARAGLCPVILERGADIDTRAEQVRHFWETGELNPESNVQFGEGGAGTFSDGKLTTRISDPRCAFVLEQFWRHGAPEEIRWQAKPHIGTDRLRSVVRNIREEIRSLGGSVRFSTRLTGIRLRGGQVAAACTDRGEIETGRLILAPGHSARDLLQTLFDMDMPMESKPFSVGVRIEHRQAAVDRALYGDLAGHPLLPSGEYQLSHRENGRAVYTFCMCPGGMVVPAASEAGMVVTNGMSEYARDGENANAALVVSVDTGDFGPGVLAGVEYQRALERNAYVMAGGGYLAPAQSVGHFLAGKPGIRDGGVAPGYLRGVRGADLTQLFSEPVTNMLREGLMRFGRKLRGFDAPEAVLTGPETRTSSPVRILRGEDGQAAGVRGLYPCGEGAGYAGGIMSAAVDGIRAAQQLLESQ